jgi:hypothetical protein
MALTVFPLYGITRQQSNFTLSATNWNASWPVTNLQDDEYAKVGRSVGIGGESPDATPVISGTSNALRAVQAFAICAHNMSLTATYRLQLFRDTAMTEELYDSGSQKVWPAVYVYDRNFETDNFWSGQYSTAEIAGQIPLRPIILDQNYSIRGWKLTLFDPQNSDGHVQIGLLEVAEGWQPSAGIELGAQDGYRSFTAITELPGGLERHDIYPAGYTVQGVMPYLQQDEAQERGYELLRQYDVHTPFLFVLHPSRPRTWLRTAKMVKHAGLELFVHSQPLLTGMPVNHKEYKG